MQRVVRVLAVAATLVVGLALPAAALALYGSSLTARSFAPTDPRVRYTAGSPVPDPASPSGTAVVVPATATVTLWTAGAAVVHFIEVANGAELRITLDDRATAFSRQVPSSAAHSQGTILEWGMAGGTDKVTVTVTSGALALERVWLYADASSAPDLMDPAEAEALPLVSVFGDSIADGQATLGPARNSTGWSDVLTRLRRVAVTNQSQPGTTATCYTPEHVDDVVSRHPDVVIVAFGVNDLNRYVCDATLDTFRRALGTTIDRIRASLPGVPVLVSSILPYDNASVAGEISTWNTTIRTVTGEHGARYLDPTPALSPWSDFNEDHLHPNLSGHAKLAAFWASVLPVG